MKKTLGFLLVTIISISTISAQSIATERMVFAWKNMKNMVVKSAQQMPEEHFDLIPAEGLRSFADQVKHITTSNRFFVGFLAGEDNNVANKNTLEKVSGKDAIIKDLEASFDYVIATLPKIQGYDENIDMFGQTLSRMEALMLTEHHLQREHGKITIYMRLKGIAPAKSTSWLL
ncbi:DinB family protein [Flavobacteriaceae bacterium 3-367]|uniref:DinB family protein n=1 Tax=Eudoraea algarum TaxID=3417568 RepID=UPI00328EEDC0